MSRHSVTPRSLPSLESLAAEAQQWQPQDNFSERLAILLRRTVQRARGKQPLAFYSVRQLARAFQLHHSTVATVYARLEADGLLVRVRGTHTIIPPRQRTSAKHLVVGAPIWLPGLTHLPDWQLFFVELQDELSRQGAVADVIFYRQGEEVRPEFIRRVKAHRPDVLFWLEPHPVDDKQVVHWLADTGLALFTVRDRPVMFRGGGYWTDRRRAYETGLREWAAAGIRRVLLPRSLASEPGMSDPHLDEALRGFEFTVSRPAQGRMSADDFLLSLARPDSGVIWLDAFTHLWWSRSAAAAIHQLYRSTRVMLMRSRNLGPETPADARVDALHLDYRALARRVARDLVCNPGPPPRTPPIIEWEWRSRVNTADIARESSDT
jgi:hypothetical protein